jgi:hypothetical protein
MKVGNLVQMKPSLHQLPNEPYIGKLGIVVEQNAPIDEFDLNAEGVEMWWVQWQGNCDWDIEWEQNLKVLSE